jgi:hypothetical protein
MNIQRFTQKAQEAVVEAQGLAATAGHADIS